MYPLKKTLSWLTSCLPLLFISTGAPAHEAKQNTFHTIPLTYYPQWYLGGYAFKNGPRAAGETTLLAPLFQTSDQLLFSSLRLLDKSGQPWESNLAFGYRCLNADHANLVGVYGGVDHLKTTTGDSFNQINVGAEAWYQNWFLGGNVYRPYGRHQYSAPNPQTFSFRENGGYRNIGFTETTENALPGVDAEIGRTLVDGLTVYGGGYYFHEANTRTLAGPKARAEYVFYAEPNHKILGLFDRVAVEGLVTNDAVRGINYYGGLTVGMSWGNTNANLNLKGTERHMVDRIRRDLDVVTDSDAEEVNLPMNIRDVNTLDDFNEALVDDKADVIAVHGQINGVTDATIDRNLYLTGNTYQFVRDNQPITVTLTEGGELVGEAINSPGEHGLLHIKGSDATNITLRDLSLSVDKTAPAAIFHNASDGSMGTLNVERILTDGNLKIEVDGGNNTAIIDHITDSIFNIDVDGTVHPNENGVVNIIEPHSALSFSATNGAQLAIGEISNNIIETQSVYSPAMLFRTINGNMTVENISMNAISTNDGGSPGLIFAASGGTINIENIIGNCIDTNYSGGMFFSADLAGKLNANQISDNIIQVTNVGFMADSTPIISGISVLSEKDANINIGSIIDNAISIDSTSDNIFFGINIDADGGNITGREINSNQITLENPTDQSYGIGLRQMVVWDSPQSNFIKLDSITFNQITLAGNSGDAFSLFPLPPTENMTINTFTDNIIIRPDFYETPES